MDTITHDVHEQRPRVQLWVYSALLLSNLTTSNDKLTSKFGRLTSLSSKGAIGKPVYDEVRIGLFVSSTT
eukprot:1148746-Lingulodinium_polyedra.AAC.1